MHRESNPAILYFGTPVVLVSSTNEDGSPNLAPMSSVWWLGYNAMLGFGRRSQTPQNIQRTGECVLNLPSVHLVRAVDRLARTTGSDPVPAHKVAMGYRHERDKFGIAGLTPVASLSVGPPRVLECPVQLEGRLAGVRPLAEHVAGDEGKLIALEITIVRVHVHDDVRVPGRDDRIDPDRWRPLIMSFGQFYGLGARAGASALAEIPESSYRPVSRRAAVVTGGAETSADA